MGLLAILGVISEFVALASGSSLVLFAAKMVGSATPTLRERLHTRYDPELGWVSRPNVFAPNLYGSGVYLRTNAQGFRNDRDLSRQAPPDRLRVICSGDSFTLGYGVDNEDNWCRLLEAMDHPRLESVNMGPGSTSYSCICATERCSSTPSLIRTDTGDFYRVRSTVFVGHGKPVLAIEGEKLVTRNVTLA